MPHDTPMTSMKMSAEEAKDYGPSAMADAPQYPYGLRLDLNDESLKKLGINEMPEIGSKKVIYALCEVVSVSQNESKDGPPHRSVGLQITDMSCKASGDAQAQAKPKRDPSDALYGSPEASNLQVVGYAE